MFIIEKQKNKINYNIYISTDFKDFYKIFEDELHENNKVFIITDDKVARIYPSLLSQIKTRYAAQIYEIKSGEENKNFSTVSDIYKFLIENNADRNSIILAFGGGVVGDLAGFAAATFMRGIKIIGIPTTLIAQVDSSVGGKTGYNFMGIKNIVGCFNDPAFVYISTSFLKSLETTEFNSGIGEVIKYGLIKSEDLLKLIESNIKKLTPSNTDLLKNIVHECVNIKCNIVSQDYKDTGLRNILNFGHTVGHGLEVSSCFTLQHGIAVALGMLTAIKLSEKKFECDKELYNRVEKIYRCVGIPTRYKVDNYNSFLYAIKHDKKSFNETNFVLIKEIGNCEVKVPVSLEEIMWGLKNSIIEEAD